jgi:hypothetical protein
MTTAIFWKPLKNLPNLRYLSFGCKLVSTNARLRENEMGALAKIQHVTDYFKHLAVTSL